MLGTGQGMVGTCSYMVITSLGMSGTCTFYADLVGRGRMHRLLLVQVPGNFQQDFKVFAALDPNLLLAQRLAAGGYLIRLSLKQPVLQFKSWNLVLLIQSQFVLAYTKITIQNQLITIPEDVAQSSNGH